MVYISAKAHHNAFCLIDTENASLSLIERFLVIRTPLLMNYNREGGGHRGRHNPGLF